jgi:hypothetical protein
MYIVHTIQKREPQSDMPNAEADMQERERKADIHYTFKRESRSRHTYTRENDQ